MPARRRVTVAVLALAVLLLVARYGGHVDWAGRAAVALLVATVVVRLCLSTLMPLRPSPPTGPAVDVVEADGGVPVYACAECGTQLVLLRKGNDKPPRHCGEAMQFRVVPAVEA